jgi:hypothetical protein
VTAALRARGGAGGAGWTVAEGRSGPQVGAERPSCRPVHGAAPRTSGLLESREPLCACGGCGHGCHRAADRHVAVGHAVGRRRQPLRGAQPFDMRS